MVERVLARGARSNRAESALDQLLPSALSRQWPAAKSFRLVKSYQFFTST